VAATAVSAAFFAVLTAPPCPALETPATEAGPRTPNAPGLPAGATIAYAPNRTSFPYPERDVGQQPKLLPHNGLCYLSARRRRVLERHRGRAVRVGAVRADPRRAVIEDDLLAQRHRVRVARGERDLRGVRLHTVARRVDLGAGRLGAVDVDPALDGRATGAAR